MDGSQAGNASRGCGRGWIHQAVHVSLQCASLAAALQSVRLSALETDQHVAVLPCDKRSRQEGYAVLPGSMSHGSGLGDQHQLRDSQHGCDSDGRQHRACMASKSHCLHCHSMFLVSLLASTLHPRRVHAEQSQPNLQDFGLNNDIVQTRLSLRPEN